MPDTIINNRLKTLFDTAPIKIWMSDEQGNYYNFNKRWLDFRGNTLEEEINKGWQAAIHPDDLELYTAIYDKAFEGRKPFETECRLKRADGEYRTMLVKAEPEFLNGTFSGYVGTCMDITNSKVVQSHNQRIASLLDETNAIAKVGGWEYDIASRQMTWTKEVYKIHELEEQKEVTLEYTYSFCHPDDKELLKASFQKAVLYGESFNTELRIVTACNNHTWINIRGKAVYVNGNIERIIGAIQDITQQKNADLALTESERRLHFVLDSLPVAVYLTDASGFITNYNKSAEDLWGKKPAKGTEKWTGSARLYSSTGTLIAADHYPMAIAIYQDKIIHAEEVISENEAGERTNNIVFTTPYKNTQGEVDGALNVLVDITERKQLEEKLTSLSLVARKTSNAVIISDAKGIITWVNQSFTNMSGYTLEEAIGKRPSELLHCEETDKYTVETVQKALENEQAIRFEVLNKGKLGNKYWLDVDVQPLRDENGKLSGFVSVETDITEIKYIHEELKKSENKLRAILDSTSDDNILVDPDYKIISINKVAMQNLKRAYGSSPSIGQLIWDYVKDEMRPEFEQTFNLAVAGFMSKKERQLAIKGDARMWFEFCFYPVYSHDGGIIGVAINSKNIHAKKIAELRVQRQNKKLKEIAFTQSHTLRRPVANIMGLWNLINHENKTINNNMELLELMRYLGRSVNEMDQVIRNITSNTYNMEV